MTVYTVYRQSFTGTAKPEKTEAVSLDDAAQIAGLDTWDIEAAIEAEGWCGSAAEDGSAIVVTEQGERLCRSAAYFLQGDD